LLRERTFACLDHLPSAERDTLLATVQALADSDWSPTAAAVRARCHRNTITYRLTVIESLHGRRIETGRDKLLWTLALLTGAD
jgi:sugar diacid utilization regulator